MVGLIEREEHITTQFFKKSGDEIFLIGGLGDELGASHFLKVCHGRKEGLPPRLNIELELAVQEVVREMIRAGYIKSAHDCSEGGLAVALAESCFNPDHLLGAEIKVGVEAGVPAAPSNIAGDTPACRPDTLQRSTITHRDLDRSRENRRRDGVASETQNSFSKTWCCRRRSFFDSGQ
jgi:phosphoribosylformylglycinamidine (FGAM) synthase-like enzyme